MVTFGSSDSKEYTLFVQCFKKINMLSLIGFTSQRRMALYAILAILLFARLGFWQIQRAQEKAQMLTAQRDFAKQEAIFWDPNRELPAQYQQLRVHGRFLPQILLLDNQHHQHQFGYDVISPLLLANGSVILVNRGWIPGDISRQTLPVLKSPQGLMDVVGAAYYPSTKSWALGDIIEKKQDNIVVVELIDIPLLKQVLQKSLYPFTIRLGELAADGYVREWPIVAMSPQRHYAYALQWFAMALTVVILLIIFQFRKKS